MEAQQLNVQQIPLSAHHIGKFYLIKFYCLLYILISKIFESYFNFRMAPEVILAMDEGQYDGKVDVWSTGITCIELAERKPPYFNMNAMSALYHIAQNDSPTLQVHNPDWSPTFRSFVELCLKKSPFERPSSSELLSHQFVSRHRPVTALIDLIARTKAAVRELDNLNYRKMKKILMIDNCDTESNIGDADETHDDQLGGDSSKSNSINSEHSMQSIGGIVPSSQNSSSSSIQPNSESQIPRNASRHRIPPMHPSHHQPQPQYVNAGMVHGFGNHHHHHPQQMMMSPQMQPQAGGTSRDLLQMPSSYSASHHNNVTQVLNEHGPNNFATIRTTSIVTKQQKEHLQEDMHEQMSGYKRMRREHQAALLKLEEKCKNDMETHKAILDKEYDSLLHNFTKELEKLSTKHQQELERRVKQNNAAEKKLAKEIAMRQDGDRKAFDTHRKKEYKANKERWKRELSLDDSTPRRQRDATLQ